MFQMKFTLSLALATVGGLASGSAIAQNNAAATAAAQGADCTAAQPFYWEIGSATGSPIVSGQVGGSTYDRTTVVGLASSSKWIFGAYAAEKAGGVPSSAVSDALNMQEGHNDSFSPLLCAFTNTVRKCHTVSSNDDVNQDIVGSFYYGGGDGQYAASDLMGLKFKTVTSLATEVLGTLSLSGTFGYRNPGVAGGMEGSAADYATFLQKMMSGDYQMSYLLDHNPVSTTPCAVGYDDCSPVGDVDMDYSLFHWIENHTGGTLPNGEVLSAGDGAFSSAGAKGFYPWITADKQYYGILSREGALGSFDESLVCGQAIREAFFN